MGHGVIDQKLERAIGDGGLMAKPFGGQTLQDLISPHGAMFFEQDLQGPAPHWGQSQTALLGQSFGMGERAGGAMVVVMCIKSLCHRLWLLAFWGADEMG